jgi:hypothetical protein
MKGRVTGVGATAIESHIPGVDSHYWVVFSLIVDHVADLPFNASEGQWWAYVCNPTTADLCGPNGPTSPAGLFTTDYADAHVSLNSYLWTVGFRVPNAATGILVGLGLGLLCFAAPSKGLTSDSVGDGVHYRVRAPKAAIDRIRATLR